MVEQDRCRMIAKSLALRVGCHSSENVLPKGRTLEEIIGREFPRRTFKAGQQVFPLDGEDYALMAAESGSIEIFIECGSRQVTVKRIGPGTIFGYMPSLGIAMLYTKARAVGSCRVAVLDYPDVERVCGRWPEFAARCAAVGGPRLIRSEKYNLLATFAGADSRVAALLLELADARGVVSGLSHEDIAYRVGMRKKSVTEALSVMRRAGLLKTARRRITLIDRPGLREVELRWLNGRGPP